MLYYDKDTDKVEVKPEFKNARAIKELHSKDKSKLKKYFYKVVTYAYYMYNPESDYIHLENLKERNDEIINQFENFSVTKDKEFYNDKNVRSFIESYKKAVWTQETYDYDKITKKIQEQIKYILEYDQQTKRKISIDVPYKFKKPDDEITEGIQNITKVVDIYDIKTFTELTKQLKELYDLKDDLRKKLIESKFHKKTEFNFMFDGNEV